MEQLILKMILENIKFTFCDWRFLYKGTGLPSDSSYPFQLSISLNTLNGFYKKDYAVVNLGLSAYGGEQNLLLIKSISKRWDS